MVILIAPLASLAGLSSSEASTAIYGLAEEHPQLLVKGRLDPATGMTTETYTESDLAAIQAALPGSTMAEFEVLNTPVEYPAELEARKAGMGDTNGGWYIAPERLALANAQLLALLDDNRLNSALASDGMVMIGVEERSTSINISGVETNITEVPVSVSRFSFPRVLVTEPVAETLSDAERRTFALFQRPGTWWENPFDSPPPGRIRDRPQPRSVLLGRRHRSGVGVPDPLRSNADRGAHRRGHSDRVVRSRSRQRHPNRCGSRRKQWDT